MKAFFLNSWKRFTILIIALVGVILAIILGTHFYTAQNARKSTEYATSAEYVIEVKSSNPNEDPAKLAEQIYTQLDRVGIKGIEVTPEHSGESRYVRVTYPETTTRSEVERIRDEIIHKPQVVLTDVWGNPLFTPNGNFNRKLIGNPGGTLTDLTDFDWKNGTRVPLATDRGAQVVNFVGESRVALNFETNKYNEWTEITKYISSLKDEINQKIVVWLDIDNYINLLKNTAGEKTSIWEEANKNPYNAAFVGNDPKTKQLRDSAAYFLGNVSNYMVATVPFKQPDYKPFLMIEGLSSFETANSIVRAINLGNNDYTLSSTFVSTLAPTLGDNAFQKSMIAGVVIFAIIALIMVVNYGLLGALSTISLALLAFITMTLFTVMRGEYSPESMIALIIGMAIAIDANIITFERLKDEVYRGHTLNKAVSIATRRSFWTSFDANIMALLLAFVVFYFGARSVAGLSMTLIISLGFTIIVLIGFTKITSTLLINTGYFEKRRHLLGVSQIDITIKERIEKINFFDKAKYFNWFSLGLIGVGILVFAITAGVAGSAAGGFSLGQEFKEQAVYQFRIDDGHTTGDVLSLLKQNGVAPENVIYGMTGENVSTMKVVSPADSLISGLTTLGSDPAWADNFLYTTTSTKIATSILLDVTYAFLVSFGIIGVYTLFRFRWVIAAVTLIILVQDLLLALAIVIITRVSVSPIFVAGLIAIMGYSISDTLVVFDQVRERIKLLPFEKQDAKSLRVLASEAIHAVIKRSIYVAVIIMIAVLIILGVTSVDILPLATVVFISLICAIYSSLFGAMWIWAKLQAWNAKIAMRHRTTNFWNTSKIEEQTVVGINDF